MRILITIAAVIWLAAQQAIAAERSAIDTTSLMSPKIEFTPRLPIWDKNPNLDSPSTHPSSDTSSAPSLLRFNGSMLRAPDERKSTTPSTTADPMSRLAEQRLLDNYGTKGWEQMAVDGQLRLASPQQKTGFAPYVTGGMGVTQLSSNNITNDPAANGAFGLRYGAGMAYSIGDAFDFTAGYRVNRMDERPGSSLTGERLNMQMLDFGLRYKY